MVTLSACLKRGIGHLIGAEFSMESFPCETQHLVVFNTRELTNNSKNPQPELLWIQHQPSAKKMCDREYKKLKPLSPRPLDLKIFNFF
jgi:hypothetical protein